MYSKLFSEGQCLWCMSANQLELQIHLNWLQQEIWANAHETRKNL